MSVSSVTTFNYSLNNYQQHNYSNASSWFGKVVVFLQRAVVDRFSFAEPAVESLANTISSLANTILRTVWSATAGLLFTNATLRNYALDSAKDIRTSLTVLVSSLSGVILCPAAAKKLDQWINSL